MPLPAAGSDVVIATAAPATITHTAGQADFLRTLSLAAQDTLAITAGSLNFGASSSLNGAVNLVTGSGSVNINGGTAQFSGAFNENVDFTGSAGVLDLAQSQSYTGTVTGLAQSGGTQLDLRDIGFVNASEATFAGTATGGTLTVTDGTHTALISLFGNYMASSFVTKSDGHGGVLVSDPPKSAPAVVLGGASMH